MFMSLGHKQIHKAVNDIILFLARRTIAVLITIFREIQAVNMAR